MAFWLIVFGLIVYLLWYKSTTKNSSNNEKKTPGASFLTVLFAIVLFIAVSILLNLIWDDLGDAANKAIVAGVASSRSVAKLNGIIYHSIFAVPIIILALALYFGFYKKGMKYMAVIVPYLIATVFITLRLLFDIGNHIIDAYDKAGMYAVLIFLIAIFSGIVFFVQQKWEQLQNK